MQLLLHTVRTSGDVSRSDKLVVISSDKNNVGMGDVAIWNFKGRGLKVFDFDNFF